MWSFKQWGDKTAIITEEEIVSYIELDCIQQEIGKLLDKRTMIIIVADNTLSVLSTYIASIESQVVPLLLPKKTESSVLAGYILDYRPRYILCKEYKEEHLMDYLILKRFSDGYVLLDTLLNSYELNEELALLLTTSGSTGSRKLVKIAYDNLKNNTKSICEALELNSQVRAVTTLPMNYTFGLSIVNTCLYRGGTVLITALSVVNAKYLSFFKKNKGNMIAGVPYTYELLDKMNFITHIDNQPIVFLQAGGRLSIELQRKFATFSKHSGGRMYIMYGQTEGTARLTYLPYQRCLDKLGSVGVAIPNGKINILVDGEILYCGKNVCMGYAYQGKDLNVGDVNHGVLYTGDVGYIDKEGYLYITGRKTRFVKQYGVRIELDNLEKRIFDLYHIVVLAIGKDDYLYLFSEDEKIDNIYCEICNKLKLDMLHTESIYRKFIPRTETGKIDYGRLTSWI